MPWETMYEYTFITMLVDAVIGLFKDVPFFTFALGVRFKRPPILSEEVYGVPCCMSI